MFAVIETGSKQYRVAPGQTIKIEKLEGKAGDAVTFDTVLLTVDGENMKLGTPSVAGAQVTGKIVKQGKNDTVIVFKYSSKTRRRKKNGHRQPFTEVEITGIK
jgi:large subunit ribosomal protein L21